MCNCNTAGPHFPAASASAASAGGPFTYTFPTPPPEPKPTYVHVKIEDDQTTLEAIDELEQTLHATVDAAVEVAVEKIQAALDGAVAFLNVEIAKLETRLEELQLLLEG